MTNGESNDLTRAYAAIESEDYKLARELLEREAGNNSHSGSLHLGWLCEQGLGGAVDTDRALVLYELARNHDRCLGSYHLGSMLMKKGKKEEARLLFEESANLGSPSAAYWAYALNEDAGSKERARQFLAQAAQLGHVFAQRDAARIDMQEAQSIRKWISAFRAYWMAKARGISLVIRDIHDPRVR